MSPTRSALSGLLVAVLAFSVLVAAPAVASAQEEPEEAHVLIFNAAPAGPWHDAAIEYGTPRIQAALEAAGITSEASADSSLFNDEDLARFDAIVMFQTNGDPWNAEQKAALQRYQQAGNGIAAIHNATDMRGGWDWWDDLVGSLMPGHAATSPPLGLEATIQVEDTVHPSTDHLDHTWVRQDEWYNFSTNVRGDAHVLMSMDESTYNPGGNAMGYDHPISWCKPYDGGRAWATALGHFPEHYDEADVMAHMVGGIEYAAGVEEGDCGGTVWEQFEKVAIDENTSAPFDLTVAPDGRVFYTELVTGEIQVWDPETQNTTTAVQLDVYSGGEDGLLGIAVGPDFSETGHIYVYWAPDSEDNSDPANFFSRVSRFTVDEDSTIDPASEELIIEFPSRRLPDEPGHTGGTIAFDLEGNLLIGIGDDVNPHSEPSGGYAPLSEREGTFHDARATSANTNDLRGKVLRVTPNPDAPGYTIPEGNLFPESEDAEDKTLPEIYAMGFRNAFRLAVDPNTGAIALIDYGPDNGGDSPNRGPAGMVEYNLLKEPGFYGWPLCHGHEDNGAYLDVDYTTSPVTVGEPFDCENPVNDSALNTGLTELPPVKWPLFAYGYDTTTVGSIAAGGGLAPIAGDFYDYDPDSESDTKWPEYYDGTAMFAEWSRNDLYNIIFTGDTEEELGLLKVNPFMTDTTWRAPQSMEFGPDGSLYVLEWGGGFGRDNPDSGLYRIDYISGSRSPIPSASADTTSGQAPLTVTFSSEGTTDPEGEQLTYAWDFDGDGETDSTEANPTHTYEANGVYQARLTVTDPHGKTGTTVVPITVGNTAPTVEFNWPPDGGFFEFGDEVSWDVSVTDPEDDTIDEAEVIVSPALGHDDHAHPTAPSTGTTGSVQTSLGGHEETENIFYALDARYTDQGANDQPALTGSETVVLQPKTKQAEHADMTSEGLGTAAAAGDVAEGGDALVGLGDGDWAAFEPVNLTGIDSIAFRVASATDGGTIELRRGAPDGELLGTAEVPSTGGVQSWRDVVIDAPDSTESMALYFVFTGDANFRLNFVEFQGKGISPETRPQVAITYPTPTDVMEPGDITVTADVTDAENTVTEVEFFVDGQSMGTDTEAPYSMDWHADEEGYYTLMVRATNDAGMTGDSRPMQVVVGDIAVEPPWVTFANVDADFQQLGDNFTISAAGRDVWSGTNEFGAVYLPDGAPENFVATVRVASFDGTHTNSKAGIMVRNDITAVDTSPGYLVLSEMGNGTVEFLHDAGGDGALNNTNDEPNANGCPADEPTWLRVAKFGTDFTVYCSEDGTEWEQVGETIAIPSADAVQDIGLFVTSHIQGTQATAEFTDWSIDLDPEVPDPDPDPDPDPEPTDPPTCLGARSDDFSGDAIDTARWTMVRGADGNLPTVADGALQLPVTNGDINEGSTGPISFVGQPVPDEEWSAVAEVTLDHDNEWQHVGLMQHVDDDNYTKFAFTQRTDGSRFFEFQTEDGGSRTWHGDNTNVDAEFGDTVWLRLDSDGENLTAHYATDGEDWQQVGEAGALLDGGHLGIVAAGDTDEQNVVATVEEFRVTPDDVPNPGIDDEFDGDSIDGCRWNRIVRWNGDAVSLSDGQLHIETEPGDINAGNNDDPRNFILQDAPEGDWTIETKMTAPLQDNWQLGGFMVYEDDDNYVKLDVVADNQEGQARVLRAELRAEVDGSISGPEGEQDIAPPASDTDTWWLRLTKSGNTYTGQISADGETWTDLPGSVTAELEDPAFGLQAIGPDQGEPITISFDYFRLVEDTDPPADETPPTVTVDVAGDGTEEVTVTLTGDDGDGSGLDRVEYNIDGGEFLTYEEPIVLTEPGEHVVGYHAFDVEGNMSAHEEVTVTVAEPEPPADTDPPTVTAAVDGDGSGTVTVELTADDGDGSGVESVEYRLDGGEWSAYDGAVEVTEPGDHTLEFRATDADGNVSEVGSVDFTVVDESAECPDPDDSDTVMIGDYDTGIPNADTGNGCTIDDLIDDEGDWRNRGQFLRHVSEVSRDLYADGMIGARDRAALIRAAARGGVADRGPRR